ncbi:hypothetical protein G6F63_014586 [Rhizopus arrhizus]|nr:hypothetical protein G6F63_014586 [Rhizopus arrhizus]
MRLPVGDGRAEARMLNQPRVQAFGTARCGPGRDQDEYGGRQPRHEDADDAGSQADVRQQPPRPAETHHARWRGDVAGGGRIRRAHGRRIPVQGARQRPASRCDHGWTMPSCCSTNAYDSDSSR